MKKLKLLLLTLLSVLSFNLFSQTQVYTTNTTGPNICDGTAVLDTTQLLISTYLFCQKRVLYSPAVKATGFG